MRAHQHLTQTILNTLLLSILMLILISPLGISLVFLPVPRGEVKLAFEITPSTADYGEYLSLGEVAGGQAEEVSLTYTAFPNFEAYYDGVFVVKNTAKRTQTFVIKNPEKPRVQIFFGQIGADSGPEEITLEKDGRALINLVASPTLGQEPTTHRVTFTLESFPTPQ